MTISFNMSSYCLNNALETLRKGIDCSPHLVESSVISAQGDISSHRPVLMRLLASLILQDGPEVEWIDISTWWRSEVFWEESRIQLSGSGLGELSGVGGRTILSERPAAFSEFRRSPRHRTFLHVVRSSPRLLGGQTPTGIFTPCQQRPGPWRLASAF